MFCDVVLLDVLCDGERRRRRGVVLRCGRTTELRLELCGTEVHVVQLCAQDALVLGELLACGELCTLLGSPLAETCALGVQRSHEALAPRTARLHLHICLQTS